MCPSLRIGSQLPAPIINGGGDTVKNGLISNFKGLVTLTLTLDSGHTAYHCASLIYLYLQAKFH